MLASHELKQQMAEAAQIAKEAAEPKKAKKAPTEATKVDEGRAPDLTGGVDVEILRFPANVMMANGSSSLGIGNNYSNSGVLSGVVRRIVLMPGCFSYASVESTAGLRWIAIMPTGMVVELAR